MRLEWNLIPGVVSYEFFFIHCFHCHIGPIVGPHRKLAWWLHENSSHPNKADTHIWESYIENIILFTCVHTYPKGLADWLEPRFLPIPELEILILISGSPLFINRMLSLLMLPLRGHRNFTRLFFELEWISSWVWTREISMRFKPEFLSKDLLVDGNWK